MSACYVLDAVRTPFGKYGGALVGLGLALALYSSLSFFGLPVLLVYGIIRGMDQATPDVILPQFIGALLGRYYFSRKFGDMWPQYRVVFFAGYGGSYLDTGRFKFNNLRRTADGFFLKASYLFRL